MSVIERIKEKPQVCLWAISLTTLAYSVAEMVIARLLMTGERGGKPTFQASSFVLALVFLTAFIVWCCLSKKLCCGWIGIFCGVGAVVLLLMSYAWVLMALTANAPNMYTALTGVKVVYYEFSHFVQPAAGEPFAVQTAVNFINFTFIYALLTTAAATILTLKMKSSAQKKTE